MKINFHRLEEFRLVALYESSGNTHKEATKKKLDRPRSFSDASCF